VEDLIFTRRDFRRSGEEHSRIMTSAEYDGHILDCEDVILLESFARTIGTLHAWKIEIERIRDEDGNVADHLQYPPLGLPHNYPNERIFVEQIGKCSKEIFRARNFRSDVVSHLYPYSREPDISLFIIP
jgi:hypothetical protein